MEFSKNPIVAAMASSQSEAPEAQTQEAPVQEMSDNSQEASEVNLRENNEVEETPLQEQTSDIESESNEVSDSTEAENLPSGEADGEVKEKEEEVASNDASEKPWWEEGEQSKESTEDVDFSAVSKALGIEGSSLDDITKEYSSLQEKVSEYEEKLSKIDESSPYANEDIAKMNEIAQNGGDYKSYLELSQVDYDLVEDGHLLQHEFGQLFQDDVEGLQNYLSGMNPADAKVKAAEVRNKLKMEQQMQMQQIQRDATEKKAKVDADIRGALDGTKELFGMKVTPGVKKDLYNNITTQGFMNKIFYKKDGSLNPEGIVKAAFLIDNINDIMKHNMTKYVNQGKGEVFREASNPKLSSNGQYAAPAEKKSVHPVEGFINHLKQGGPY